MRQVDRDELTYAIYSGMRVWSVTILRRLFDRRDFNRNTERCGACKQIAYHLRYLLILRSDYSAVSQDELEALFAGARDRFPGAIGKLWLSQIEERRQEARQTAANLFADALDPYEVLSKAPYGPTLRFRDLAPVPHALRATWP